MKKNSTDPAVTPPTAAEDADALLSTLVVEDTTFFVPLGTSGIEFRMPKNASEFRAIEQVSERSIRTVKKLPSAQIKPYSGLPDDIIRQAFWVETLAVKPKFSTLQALKLSDCGGALPYLNNALMSKIGQQLIQCELDDVEEEKN